MKNVHEHSHILELHLLQAISDQIATVGLKLDQFVKQTGENQVSTQVANLYTVRFQVEQLMLAKREILGDRQNDPVDAS